MSDYLCPFDDLPEDAKEFPDGWKPIPETDSEEEQK